LTYGYQERDERKRTSYLDEIKDIPESKRVYLDESGIDDNEVYSDVWGVKGSRIYSLKQSFRKKRLSMMVALNQGKIKAPCVLEGYWDRSFFEGWVEKFLLLKLEPGQVVILDNAAFHKGEKVRKLIENAGGSLIYLPPYSSDFNPIEHWWFVLKHPLRLFMMWCERNLDKAAKWVFKNVLTYK